jgi:hypothetical protein
MLTLRQIPPSRPSAAAVSVVGVKVAARTAVCAARNISGSGRTPYTTPSGVNPASTMHCTAVIVSASAAGAPVNRSVTNFRSLKSRSQEPADEPS